MFAAIAPSYDLNNRLHSFWMDQRWRRNTVRLAQLKPTDVVVDVACGTGDLTLAFDAVIRQLDSGNEGTGRGRVIGIDYTFEMLPIANQKAIRHDRTDQTDPASLPWGTPICQVAFLRGDAQTLPLSDQSADVVSIAFGLRNVQSPDEAIAEFYRVLKPGGRVVILEFSKPTHPLIRWANDVYCVKIMPHTATWISGDSSGAYKYLPMSVATFMSREQTIEKLRIAGFVNVHCRPMTFGVAVCYVGGKP